MPRKLQYIDEHLGKSPQLKIRKIFKNLSKEHPDKFRKIPKNATEDKFFEILGYPKTNKSYETLANLYNTYFVDVKNEKIDDDRRVARNLKLKQKRDKERSIKIGQNADNMFALHELPLSDAFKFLQKNKFNISTHTISYNITEDYDWDTAYKKLKFKSAEEINRFTENCILKLYNKLMSYVRPECYFRILLESKQHKNCSTSKLEISDSFTLQQFIEKFLSFYDCDDLFTGKFIINILRIPSGGGTLENVPEFLKKRGISIVYNDDDYCGQRCLALADAKNHDDLKNMKKNREAFAKMWSKRAVLIAEEIDVKSRMAFTDFEKWANLRHKQVIILSEMFQVIYTTEITYPEKVYLYYDAKIEHYHFIHDINSATNDICRNSKWCNLCHKAFRFDTGAFAKHKCVENTCYFCKTDFLCKETLDQHFHKANWINCSLCNCVCPTNECKEKHEKICKGKSIRCNKCKKYINKDHFTNHKCGEEFCTICNKYFTGTHRCFINPLPKTEPVKSDTWVFDFESEFDDNNVHIVNLCIAMKLYSDETFVCKTIEEFAKFALSKRNTTFIAHNAKAYDTWLLHKYLINHTNKRPNKLVLAGQKIMYMKIKSIRFIDSLNHIAQALETFPKTFGIKEMKKGFFPYLFNKKENTGYKGDIPDMKYFSPDDMKIEKRNEFLLWYNQQTGLYDFDKELFEYCKSDVMILKTAMEIYINDGINSTGINPILCPTIASYAMKVYRTNFLENNKICVLTKEEYDFCRRGFFGGRTEVFQLKALAEDVDDGKFIKYQDIQSLYPTVQFFDNLPCGAPKWDIEPVVANVKEYLNSNFGYIECDITCPKDLHIPVLGEKKDCKLIFDLVDKNKAVYSSVELLRAVELGYKITKIYKSLSFDKCDDLFKGYIQTFLKIKTECNGYDGDDIDDYIKRYNKHCGVLLDKSKVKPNKGMKLLAKILLNSLWGKFGQKDDMPTTEYYTDPSKWFRLLDKHIKGDVEIKTETMIDENTLYVQYISKETKCSSLNTTNLALAGFTTAQARLRLYKELYQLDSRAIYCDTDSIIYHYDKNKYNIPEGDMLGEWEGETKSPIIEVLALAPKSYGYKCLDGTGDIKCKGITLNFNNSKKFNHISLSGLIDGTNTDGCIKTNKMEFLKDKKNGTIQTNMKEKIISFTPDTFKRTINKDFTTTARV